MNLQFSSNPVLPPKYANTNMLSLVHRLLIRPLKFVSLAKCIPGNLTHSEL